MKRETYNLEFKESVSNTFLKTVSAFANYGDGRVLFGVDDNGQAIGLKQVTQTCLDIENRINDSLSPVPDYKLEINDDDTITLWVYKGPDTPYLYKNKAYRRNDSATVEVDRTELKRLILSGMNRNFEDLPSHIANLNFHVLENFMQKQVGIRKLNQDILKTLGLLTSQETYNRAAELLADENTFPGIDIIRFGNSIDEIRARKRITHVSVLLQYQEALQFFREYYTYEKIEGAERQLIETIPEKAVREAIANSLVHRMWDISADIHISFFADRVEITSPGGLPEGISKEEYLYHQISILRNPKIANVFYRLGYIESFGTGIQRIFNAYAASQVNPSFDISENAVKITLPLLQLKPELTRDESVIVQVLRDNRMMSRQEIEEQTPFTKAKVIRLLNALIQKEVIRKMGNGRGTKYTKKC